MSRYCRCCGSYTCDCPTRDIGGNHSAKISTGRDWRAKLDLGARRTAHKTARGSALADRAGIDILQSLAADVARHKKRVEFLEKYLKALSHYLRVLADWE